MDDSLPLNHVFIDFENVHEFDPDVVGGSNMSLTLLVGAKQTKLNATFVEKLLHHAGTVQFVRLSSSGRNALDFTLAYYLGRAAAADPAGRFHIISGDKGFDPLVEHLQSRNIRAFRHSDLSTITAAGALASNPAPPPPKPKATPVTRAATKPKAAVSGRKDLMAAVLTLLNKVPARRPKKYASLVSHLKTHIGKGTTEAQVKSLIDDLQKEGHLSVGEKGAITYAATTKESALTLTP